MTPRPEHSRYEDRRPCTRHIYQVACSGPVPVLYCRCGKTLR